MQPSHAISDKRWAESRLGEYRVLGAYAWHFMKSYGVHVPFGTDFPVEPINPYNTLYAAVSRQDADGDPVGGWQPQERLTIAAAIRCHTFESAYAEFSEKEKGEIKTGMLADLVVHSKDLLTIEPKEILTTSVLTICTARYYQKYQNRGVRGRLKTSAIKMGTTQKPAAYLITFARMEHAARDSAVG